MKSCNLIRGRSTGQFGYRLECGKYAHSSCPGPNECTEKNGPFAVKICARCKQEFPATPEFFHRKKSTKDGLQFSCKKYRLSAIGDYQKTLAGRRTAKRAYKKSYATINGRLGYVFSSMKQRCTNPHCRSYRWYGRRGIIVCFKSADEFIGYVVNELRVDPRGLTIDRINNDGNYERGNIRFITKAENNKNQRGK